MTTGLLDTLIHDGAGDKRRPVLLLLEALTVTLDGANLRLPESTKRLVAFVALQHGRVDRRFASGTMWPDVTEDRAAGNLRSALWRLRKAQIDLVAFDDRSLALHPDVCVDAHLLSRWAARLVAGTERPEDLSVPLDGADCLDLLPGWYDEWVVVERERLRQRVLRALEVQSDLLRRCGRTADAIDVALSVVLADPLRESAQRALLQAHIAHGNCEEAHRCFAQYRDALERELGIVARPELFDLLSGESEQGRHSPVLTRA